ncbi:glycosyltransferase family 2 protein [uncultured Kocuria sp.]|uniref:glycosyltransferase family 2 protein n=1 Tax=uncultured Kocuria sp. TaxID=259305 RepID=UPI00259AA0A4|nr:glycosyltransferase family A protein [uncultured Kocuria sp.]MCT1366534.1 glycosyltransferase family 2 protein [Rothia sp. p3-SID1597]
MQNHPQLSVIVPCHNGVSTLPMLLESLEDQHLSVNAEVLLCDNGSTDDLRGFVRRWSSSVFDLRYVEASAHRGAAFARNRGISEARADKLAFCDADDAVGPVWMRSAIDALDAEPVVNGSALSVPADVFRSTNRLAEVREARLRHDVPGHLPLAGMGDVAPALMGGNFAAQRTYLVNLGGFDASMWRGGEDNDLSYRIAATGLKLRETEGMGILYRDPANLSSSLLKSFQHARSLALVCARHDAWSSARPYERHPLVTLARCAGSFGKMLLGKKQKDLASVASRASTALGLLDGLVRYTVFRRTPESQVSRGLVDEG